MKMRASAQGLLVFIVDWATDRVLCFRVVGLTRLPATLSLVFGVD